MIDTAKIPAADMRVLCSTLLEAAKRFYDTPENRRQYEAWLAERKRNGGTENDRSESHR